MGANQKKKKQLLNEFKQEKQRFHDKNTRI